VVNITVTGTFSGGGTGTVTCKSGTNGACTFSKSVPNTAASLTFTVTNLSFTNMVYQPGLNHDPEADSNGTVITLTKP
jgi:hypothetical protein